MRIVVVLVVLEALGCKHEPPAIVGKVELVPALPRGDVDMLVVPEVTRAKHDGKHLIVYVGADWCEPCRKFHASALTGELDRELGDMRFLEFDFDRDQERLDTAGYTSNFIPLFAVPRDDGRASGKQTAGVKGEGGMVEQLIPRVRALAPR